MNIALFASAPENLVVRDGFDSPVPRQPAHLHAQAESHAYIRDSSRFPQRRPNLLSIHLKWKNMSKGLGGNIGCRDKTSFVVSLLYREGG